MKPWEAKHHLPFSQPHADRAVVFFEECLRHHLGRWAGRPFILEPFQKEIISEIFGRVDEEGNRYIREFFFEVPKKNGKSPLAAGIVGKLLFADDEPAAHVYGAAWDREQAGIVFEYASSMFETAPELAGLCKVKPGRKVVEVPGTKSFYRIVSSEVAGKHGYNTHGLVVDEVHALADFRLWDVLTYGAGAARTQPLFGGLTTAGVSDESPVAEEKHETAVEILKGIRPCPDWFFPVVFAADEKDDWSDRATWEACNPALGRFLDWKTVEKEYEEAQQNLRQQNNFFRYRLNRWVNQVERWIDLDLWDARSEQLDIRDLRDYPCVLGVDLSSKIDLTAVTVVFQLPSGYAMIPFAWVPEETLKKRDSIEADNYRQWIAEGHLMTCPGAEIDYSQVEEFIVKLKTDYGLKAEEVVFDRMYAGQMAQRLEKHGFVPIEFSQRAIAHWTESCLEFEAALESGRLKVPIHPLFRWCANCVQIKRGPNGGIMPVKPDRMKSKKRIDPIVAGLMGLKRAMIGAPSESMYASAETAVL